MSPAESKQGLTGLGDAIWLVLLSLLSVCVCVCVVAYLQSVAHVVDATARFEEKKWIKYETKNTIEEICCS